MYIYIYIYIHIYVYISVYICMYISVYLLQCISSVYIFAAKKLFLKNNNAKK